MLELEPAVTRILFQELEAWTASAFECDPTWTETIPQNRGVNL
jgi:hypothetical protein